MMADAAIALRRLPMHKKCRRIGHMFCGGKPFSTRTVTKGGRTFDEPTDGQIDRRCVRCGVKEEGFKIVKREKRERDRRRRMGY